MSEGAFQLSEPVIEELQRKCNETIANSTNFLEEPYCKGTFDGWACWNDTPAGTEAQIFCPEIIPGFDPTRIAVKICEPDGNWYVNPYTNKTWANYTTCIDLDDLAFQQRTNNVYIVGYFISLVALLLSLFILNYFRSLRCSRITLHKHLFASFAINNLLWLIWYLIVIPDTELQLANGIFCRVLHTLLYYFLLTNYSWMLCEGVYLHTMLVKAFMNETKLVKFLTCLGWAVPVVVILIYTAFRVTSQDKFDTHFCWLFPGNYHHILLYPVVVSLVVNFLFLCNILRVLLTMLHAGPTTIGARPPRSMQQATKATLVLIPLLGLHYLVTPFQPDDKHPLFRFYSYTSAVTASFQGLCVAILFCFWNGEVISEFKRKWRNSKLSRNRANSCTATTVSFIRSTAGPITGEEKV